MSGSLVGDEVSMYVWGGGAREGARGSLSGGNSLVGGESIRRKVGALFRTGRRLHAHSMGELEAESDALEHFVASGRSGRRNALPEIQVRTSLLPVVAASSF